MNSKKTLLLVAVAAILALSSCSGLEDKCTTNCGPTGDALLSLTMSDAASATTPVVSFTLPIVGITLTPSSGSAPSVFTTGNFELTRLQSDTSLLAANVKVPAGSYTAVNVTVSAPSGVFFNLTNGTLGSCVANAVCAITGNATTITYTFPSALTLSSNANQWLNLDFNYNNAIVTTNNTLGIDMTQSAVMTASTTVPVGVASGNFANIDDFTGQITAISSGSITVTSKLRGAVTANITTSTQWFDPQDLCPGGASSSCVGVGSVVSLQGLLSTAGVVNASSVDILDKNTSPSDEVEGIIYPSSCAGGYAMILSDSVINTSGSPLASASFGSGVCLTIGQTATFAVDSGILTNQPGVPAGSGNIPGFAGISDILAGQTVRVQISGAATGNNGLINATGNLLLLRFSRLTATINTASSPLFTVTGLPAYLGTTFNAPAQVNTYLNATLLENVQGGSTGGLTGTVSFTTLYLNAPPAQYPFQAAKVRQQ
jgi:Domain of unknown function (DUF4382)